MQLKDRENKIREALTTRCDGIEIASITANNNNALALDLNGLMYSLEEWGAPNRTVTLHMELDGNFVYLDELDKWTIDGFVQMVHDHIL